MNITSDLFMPTQKNSANIAIIATRFHANIVDVLHEGAMEYFKQCQIYPPQVQTFYVPGAFELPVLAKKLFQQQKYAGILALGCVIRGDTPHFEYVAGECARGLAQVSLEASLPIAFGVLTTDTLEQAQARAGGSAGNKGMEAASALLEMITLFNKIEKE